MALAALGARLGAASTAGMRGNIVRSKNLLPVVVNQTAKITAPSHLSHADQGSLKSKPKPWPYEQRQFNLLWSFVDSTEARLDENSKIIVVEGMPAVGKSAFAESLANELGFHYLSEATCDDVYRSEAHASDQRNLDFMVSENSRVYDLKRFYNDANPQSGVPGRLQLDFYLARFLKYTNALKHLLNTGQGVVCDRSVFGDSVYADAMRACGYIKPRGLSFYNRVRVNTICELWKPHLTIYLDAPLEHVRAQITKRNNPDEVNSKVLTDEYLSRLEHGFKNNFLPEMRRYGEVLTYDATDLEDWEVIVEDIERLNLELDPEDETKFEDWHANEEQEWAWHRRYFSSEKHMMRLFGLMDGPWDAPEMIANIEQLNERNTAAMRHPHLEYVAEFNPKRGASLSNILLGIKSPVNK
ncbi:NADH dehydrogenase [ubiquinone] 1 alpha subcomplex subunit 10, mitochondrial-like [Tubulanus polymorphus]|uniref:NADH dehydrogenase [ubiquinone] 1 alpha subcomplex subunit 10, mitochondrial-like n=1 Tax=Tubulanus polymorphus TaxID=672921 RepID=UPI003DA30343